MTKNKQKGNFKVVFLNYGEPCEAWHFNKTEELIRTQYKLEGLQVISIERLENN